MQRHVLVVEDDPEFAELLKIGLEIRGFRATAVYNGESAKMAIGTYYPDLILLDLGLPDLPGEEVCRFVKHSYDPMIQPIPIIMLTGKDKDVDQVVGTVMGAAHYICKPASLVDLFQKIDHLLAA